MSSKFSKLPARYAKPDLPILKTQETLKVTSSSRGSYESLYVGSRRYKQERGVNPLAAGSSSNIPTIGRRAVASAVGIKDGSFLNEGSYTLAIDQSDMLIERLRNIGEPLLANDAENLRTRVINHRQKDAIRQILHLDDYLRIEPEVLWVGLDYGRSNYRLARLDGFFIEQTSTEAIPIPGIILMNAQKEQRLMPDNVDRRGLYSEAKDSMS